MRFQNGVTAIEWMDNVASLSTDDSFMKSITRSKDMCFYVSQGFDEIYRKGSRKEKDMADIVSAMWYGWIRTHKSTPTPPEITELVDEIYEKMGV